MAVLKLNSKESSWSVYADVPFTSAIHSPNLAADRMTRAPSGLA